MVSFSSVFFLFLPLPFPVQKGKGSNEEGRVLAIICFFGGAGGSVGWMPLYGTVLTLGLIKRRQSYP